MARGAAILAIAALMVIESAAAIEMYIPSVFSSSGSTKPASARGKKPLSELIKYTQASRVTRLVDRIIKDNMQGSDEFSVLELTSTESSIGAGLAQGYPSATWIAAGELVASGGGDQAEDDGQDEGWEGGQGVPQAILDEARVPNLISIPTEVPLATTDHLFDSPTLFTFVVAAGLDVQSLCTHHPKLLGVSKQLIVAKGEGANYQEQLAKAAAEVGVELERVRAWGGKLLEIQLRKFKRPVRHHYSDIRKCPQRGYMFTYDLGKGGVGKLERLKFAGKGSTYSPRDKDTPVKTWGCKYMNQHTSVTLSNGNYVNFMVVAGLGVITAAEQAKRRLVDTFLELPHFEDGTPWNACVAGATFVWCDRDFKASGRDKPMRKAALDGVCREFVDWSEKKTPPCSLDMMVVATYGCRGFTYADLRDRWFGSHTNSGYHPKDRVVSDPDMLLCRRVAKYGTRPSFPFQEPGYKPPREVIVGAEAAHGVDDGGEHGGEEEVVEEDPEMVYPLRRMLGAAGPQQQGRGPQQ